MSNQRDVPCNQRDHRAAGAGDHATHGRRCWGAIANMQLRRRKGTGWRGAVEAGAGSDAVVGANPRTLCRHVALLAWSRRPESKRMECRAGTSRRPPRRLRIGGTREFRQRGILCRFAALCVRKRAFPATNAEVGGRTEAVARLGDMVLPGRCMAVSDKPCNKTKTQHNFAGFLRFFQSRKRAVRHPL